ncbi:MAG: hypothetical protein GAK28_03924 [Luteibacter sp.]|nr:MAG: hypothetical protein GAK28_03924 [Luteibacter sp.]
MPPPPPAIVALASRVEASHITPVDAENVVAAAWLELRRDATFGRFCRRYHADPESLVAHPDGTFSLRSVDDDGITEIHFRPFDSQGRFTGPFALETDAAKWKSSLDILLSYTYALARDIGNDAVGISRMNGMLLDRMLERIDGEGVERTRTASVVRALELFASLYRNDDGHVIPGADIGGYRYAIDQDAFARRFDADHRMSYLTGWVTALPREEISSRVAMRVLGKLAGHLKSLYADDVMLPMSPDEEGKRWFVESMRSRVVSGAASRGVAIDGGTADFAANVLWCIHMDDLAVRNALPSLPNVAIPTVGNSATSSFPSSSVGSGASPSITYSPDTTFPPRSVESDRPSSPVGKEPPAIDDGMAYRPWTMVVKVATVVGAVLVFGAGVVTALTASQKAAVVLLGNAAAAAGATLLAIMVPGVENVASAVGTSGLLYASAVDSLVANGVAPQLAKSAAMVEVSGVYILVGVGVAQSGEALEALKHHPGWRAALKAAASILATIGTAAAGTPAADKADQASIADPQYRFFNKHPDVPERLGHTGNGAVLVGVGVLHTVDEIPGENETPPDDNTAPEDESMSWWQVLLSFFDPSGLPSRRSP